MGENEPAEQGVMLPAEAAEIPIHFFGDMEDEFYAGIGRTTNLSALLEDGLRALLQAMNHAPQTDYAGKPAGTLVKLVEARAQALGDDWATFGEFADRVRAVLDHRNALVHNLWQATSDGQFFGHRVVRGSGNRECMTISLDQVREGVAELVALREQWRYWYGLAGARIGQD